jgi:CubicO group peptidase (beta-lactamase class C family)
MFDLKQWSGVGLSEHLALYEDAKSKRYAVLTFCQYGKHTTPLYVAVMIKRADNPEQNAFWAKTLNEFRDIVGQQANLGFAPVLLSAHGPANGALFAGVFEKRDPMPPTELELLADGSPELATLPGMNAVVRTYGMRPLCVASYGEADTPRFAAVWQYNTGADAVLWNNDGTLDSLETLRQRNAAQISNWCRPVFLTLNKNLKFCSIYEASDAGKFSVLDCTNAIGFETAYAESVTSQGFLPICVQAAGEDALTASFSAIFVEKDKPMPRVWSATGAHDHTKISNSVRAAMTSTIIRQGAVAIVFKKRLVYARGFNMAESNWPQAEPTTHFRLASCSKTITALAILQLIEEGKVTLKDRMQDILKLKTPGGDEPTDPQFKDIRVQHLLEHSSGLPPTEFENLEDLTTAFNEAGRTVSLPVSAEDTDSFIATLPAVRPGSLFVYSDCGYYLLGRIVKRLRGTTTPIDAYQKHLFDPLHIQRIRRAKDLIADQQLGEARYQDPLLEVGPSVFPGEKLLPTCYGSTYHLEILDGDGGLTGAAVDVARLVAILTSQQDSPVLQWETIVPRFKRGADLTQDGHRAGYGFDAIFHQRDGTFFALKGGALPDAHSAIVIDGNWGSVSLFAAADAPNNANVDMGGFLGVYAPEPDRDSLRDHADLFPDYGMPSL